MPARNCGQPSGDEVCIAACGCTDDKSGRLELASAPIVTMLINGSSTCASGGILPAALTVNFLTTAYAFASAFDIIME